MINLLEEIVILVGGGVVSIDSVPSNVPSIVISFRMTSLKSSSISTTCVMMYVPSVKLRRTIVGLSGDIRGLMHVSVSPLLHTVSWQPWANVFVAKVQLTCIDIVPIADMFTDCTSYVPGQNATLPK